MTRDPSSVAALFDVDGTLIDTNYQHAIAWARSFARCGLHPPVWRIHRAIGMGGDQLVSAVAGEQVEQQHGDDLRSFWAQEYAPLLSEVRPLEGAHRLLARVKEAGHPVVLASSAPPEHLRHYIQLLDAEALTDHVTSADDAERTKPAPDLVSVALAKANTPSAVMVGDSTWDAIAAAKAGVDTIAVRTGGFSVEELTEAGAAAVYDSLTALIDDLGATALAH